MFGNHCCISLLLYGLYSQKYAASPDDSTFKYLAGVYADNHPLMFKSKEFVGGVTNGAAW